MSSEETVVVDVAPVQNLHWPCPCGNQEAVGKTCIRCGAYVRDAFRLVRGGPSVPPGTAAGGAGQ